MRLLHLSDLHFGTEKEDIARHLGASIDALRPDLVVVSGDFTQIGSRAEFERARAFLNGLSAPVFCVPGNHDIPRFHLWERLFHPFRKYKTYISPDLWPFMLKDGIAIAGVNSARNILPHWNWANGAISKRQRRFIRDVFASVQCRYRVCVVHHPLQRAEKAPLKVTVFGVGKAIKALHEAGVDIVLTGHVHFASVTTFGDITFLSASTATSGRLRLQENGFNVVDFHDNGFDVTHYTYDGRIFSHISEVRKDSASSADVSGTVVPLT